MSWSKNSKPGTEPVQGPKHLLERPLGPFQAPAVGLGCMNLSHAYGVPPPPEQAKKVLLKALDLGITHFDGAALYGFGRNETLLGEVLQPFRQQIVLVSKCGLTGIAGKRVIDGRPLSLRRDCEDSLRRLRTDVIDLFYLHRYDRAVPIEESIGALSLLVAAGKVRAIGLSEVSAETLRKAHVVHPIAAVQSEYSLWTRNPEIALLDACAELGVAFVAFSPLARGFLAAGPLHPQDFAETDVRRNMPRFQEPHFSRNSALLPAFRECAQTAGCTPAQLALAWLLQKVRFIHVIPGTTHVSHLEENTAAAGIQLSAEIAGKVERLINETTISGPRYNAATQAEIDTEEFPG
jgi:hypothetical protein